MLPTHRKLALYFDNVSLDPSVWMRALADAYAALCRDHPLGFVIADFAIFAALVVVIIFYADLSKWWRERHLRAQVRSCGARHHDLWAVVLPALPSHRPQALAPSPSHRPQARAPSHHPRARAPSHHPRALAPSPSHHPRARH